MPRQFYISDEERLAKILKQQARSLSDVQRPTGTEREQTLARLQSMVDELSRQQARLADAARVYSAASGASQQGPGWVTTTPAVTASSLSKQFRVTVTGGSSGGSTFLTFSAPGYPRERAIGASAEATLARAVALGGLSDAGTAQRSWVLSMPGNGPYRFAAEALPTDKYAISVGLQIDVQPLL